MAPAEHRRRAASPKSRPTGRIALIGAFALLVGAAPAATDAAAECRLPLIAGGEAAKTDCQLELHVVNPTNEPFYDARGRVNPTQTCVDGDASCDADGSGHPRGDETCRGREAHGFPFGQGFRV